MGFFDDKSCPESGGYKKDERESVQKGKVLDQVFKDIEHVHLIKRLTGKLKAIAQGVALR